MAIFKLSSAGRSVEVDVTVHAAERQTERDVPTDVILEAITKGVVVRLEGSIDDAAYLGQKCGVADRVGLFPRALAVLGELRFNESMLVRYSPRPGHPPVHVVISATEFDGRHVFSVKTCYWVNDTAKWHKSGFCTPRVWQTWGARIIAGEKAWAAEYNRMLRPVAA